MKKQFLLGVFFISAFTASAQLPADYFRLSMKYYTEGTEKYLGVSPEIRTDAKGLLGKGINQYPRRFRYLLANRTNFQNKYEQFYPDTGKINQLYAQSMLIDPLFINYFKALSAPFTKAAQPKLKITAAELMQVASRFFYCEGMKKDSTINAYVCVNMNGLKNAFTKDYTLVEAFCFEAVFETYRHNGQPSLFVKNFKAFIKEGEAMAKKTFKDEQTYVASVRTYCFERMAKDNALLEALLGYYEQHKQTLPFIIE